MTIEEIQFGLFQRNLTLGFFEWLKDYGTKNDLLQFFSKKHIFGKKNQFLVEDSTPNPVLKMSILLNSDGDFAMTRKRAKKSEFLSQVIFPIMLFLEP